MQCVVVIGGGGEGGEGYGGGEGDDCMADLRKMGVREREIGRGEVM